MRTVAPASLREPYRLTLPFRHSPEFRVVAVRRIAPSGDLGNGKIHASKRSHGEKVKFAGDSPLEGAGFEPSVPRERVCAFRDHVHSLQSVRHPLRSKWYVDYSDGTRPFGLDIHG